MPDKKNIYGIIGLPLNHSLSPLIHNTVFKSLGINAEYQLFPLLEEELENFFQELRMQSNPIMGLNVTVPYKEKVLEYFDNLSPYARKVMAVNTIAISPDRSLTGFNTDGPGFLTHLTEIGFSIAGKRIALLGAGGTARAIISTLCLIQERPHSIRIYNRHPEKAIALIHDLHQRLDTTIVQAVSSIEDLNIELADLLINTTPVGLKTEDPCLMEEGSLHEGLLVYDVIYNPSRTKLLESAEKKGAQISNGLGMLFYQGVLAFHHWMGYELDQKTKSKIRKILQNEGAP